jgi:ABC-2 type transport system ATP-binding protein
MVSTHILSEVEATCDRAIIIMNGQVRADATLVDLAATADVVLILAKTGQEKATLAALATLAGVQSAAIDREENGRVLFRIHGTTAADLCPAVYRLAREHDWPLCQLKREEHSLETVFNRIAAGPGGVQ